MLRLLSDFFLFSFRLPSNRWGFLERVFAKIGSFYVLPSSVHEVLILPDDGEPKARDLNEMIRTINENEVLPQDRLSDIAYHFDGKHLETAQDYEDRRG